MFKLGEEKYFHAAFTVDNVIFGFDDGDLKILLVKRGTTPFQGVWALPGDFVHDDETLDTASARVLRELTGLQNVYLEQVATFSKPNRHPMGRVITTASLSLIKVKDFVVQASSWASSAKWHSINHVEGLPFDHDDILHSCLNTLRQRVRVRPVGFELLPVKFTLTELQQLYEAILRPDKAIDKRNFRKKILGMDLLIDCAEFQEGVAHRPAKLYRFDPYKYEEFIESGFSFEI